MGKQKRVVVGLSGGVDSSVAAYLLKEQGYEVIGLYMKNWHDNTVTISDNCPWIEDSNDALMVANKLKIPFQTIDLSEAYREKIVNYMFETYLKGQTPNPDVLCNREIKFSVFLEKALALGADYVATGHYCQKKISKESFEQENKNLYGLFKGYDNHKDQSYFLCQINQKQLAKSLFPIGHLEKKTVRKIAKNLGLETADKRDSQGLCFVGKVKLPTFLKQQLKPKVGKVIEIPANSLLYKHYKIPCQTSKNFDRLKKYTQTYSYQEKDGTYVGEHQGAYYFTVGQRKGLNIGGKKEPLFVIGKDVKNNIVYVGQSSKHPGLYRYGLAIKKINAHWLNPNSTLLEGKMQTYEVSIRYRQTPTLAHLYSLKKDFYIIFKKPQKAIASGQFAVWYLDNELIGSGVIE